MHTFVIDRTFMAKKKKTIKQNATFSRQGEGETTMCTNSERRGHSTENLIY